MSKRQGYKKILIVRMDRIGDVVLSTPVIKAVRDAYPKSYLAVLVRPYARDVVEGNPYVDEVITYDKEGREKGFIGNVRFVLDLRRKKFDLVLVLHPKGRAHILTFLAGIRERVGYDKKFARLLTRRIPHTKQYGLKHESDYALDVLRYIGVEPKDKSFHIPLKKESEDKVRDIFAAGGIGEKDLVVAIHPGASCPSRRWNLERFARVADSLVDKRGARIVIIAGPADKTFGDKVAGFMKSAPLNLSGKTTVADIASVLRRSKLLISNDSGPVHMACAAGTPVLSIFSRKDRGISPQRWGPTGKGDVILHKDAGCEICLAHNCKVGFKCLDAITVEDVLTAAEKLLLR